ncbi:MAG: MATE family efflux transporter [Clostridiales bacterium]|nr:MATE family efflux transporter [Clostridiales bacterium]
MHKIVREKSFYKNVLAIALPIALQNFIVFATSMMDTIMLGSVGETLLSASALANQPFFILSLVCFGLSGGATVLASQYWGKRDMASIRMIFSIVLKAAFFISAVLGLAVLLAPETVMGLYSQNPEIIAEGTKYLRIIGYAYFFFGVGNTLLCSIRSVELVKISVVVNSSSFVANVFLNWVLIFGNLGAPAMGIRGAAIATLTARILEFVITMVYVLFIDKRLQMRVRDLFRFDKVFAKDLLVYGTPVLLNEVMWSLGITLQAALLGHIEYASGDPVAANSVTSMVQQLSTIVIFGIANAAAVMVGKAIGEKDLETAERRAHTLKYMSFIVGAAACLIILLLRSVAVDFYNIPEASKALARDMMVVMAVITFFVSVSSISIVGILRGSGDTRFCLTVEMISLWLVALPLAFMAAMAFHWPVPVVLLLMKIDEPLKCLLCMIRMRGRKWMKSVARDFEKPETAPAGE